MDLDIESIYRATREADWYRAVPFFLAAYNLGVMYMLEAPRSTGARVARTISYMAHILSGAYVAYPDLWVVALPMQMLGWAVLNTQLYLECLRAGRRHYASDGMTVAEKAVKTVVGEKTARNGHDSERRAD